MHLLSSLIAGIRGAENGVVQVFERATATRATWYEDFEGHGADSSGADIPLGSSGEAVVFVEELVDVVVKNSLGVTVRSWTDGYSAACVEVRSDSFTGIDYDTAASAAGNPTNVNAALSLWNDSAGSIDWEVGSGGTPLEDAVTAVEGIFYNVKAYGALGDGVADDRASIVATMNAAVAAGGGTVFFPPGVYLINSTVSQNALAPFQGAGASVSFLRMNGAAVQFTWRCLVVDLTIDQSLNLAGSPVVPATGANARMVRCVVGTALFSAAACVSTAANCAFEGCQFQMLGSAQSGIDVTSSNRVHISNCEFFVNAGTYTGVMANVTGNGAAVTVVASRFYWSNSAGSSTAILIDYDSSDASLTVTGCTFEALNSPTVTILDFDSSTDVSSAVAETGNVIQGWGSAPDAWTLYDMTGVTLTTQRYTLQSREPRRRSYADDGAALTIDSLNYGNIVVERTTNGVQTVTFTDAPVGCEVTVIYHNNHAAGGGTITFDTTRVDMVAASNQFTLAANTYRCFRFRSEYFNSTLRWVEVELAAADEPE